MPDLGFEIVDVQPMRDPEAPALSFHLRVTNRVSEEPIHAILLRCQIQIETPRRRYTSQEQEALRDLFGEPEQWAQTLRSMLWANIAVNVPSFTGSIIYPVPIPCAFDLAVGSTKYFHALEGGEVPITFLFSGNVFYDAGAVGLQMAPVPWSKEARFRLPVQVWHEVTDLLEVL